MTDLLRQKFTTYFGNTVTGFYITWNTSAKTDVISASDELTMDVVLNLYSANLSTKTGGALDVATAGDIPFVWYVSWLSSDPANSQPADNAKAYDAAKGNLIFKRTAGPPHTMECDWKATDQIEDFYCTDKACATGVKDSTEQQFTHTAYAGTGANKLCKEVWKVSDTNLICTKVEF